MQEDAPHPLLPIHMKKSDTSLRFFTTIATLGTPQDVTLQEIRIENFFAADERTAGIIRGWADGGRPSNRVPSPTGQGNRM